MEFFETSHLCLLSEHIQKLCHFSLSYIREHFHTAGFAQQLIFEAGLLKVENLIEEPVAVRNVWITQQRVKF